MKARSSIGSPGAQKSQSMTVRPPRVAESRCRGQSIRVEVPDLTDHERQDLAPLVVDAQDGRCIGEPDRPQVCQQRVDGRCPVTRLATHRVTHSHNDIRIAAVKGLLRRCPCR